jgi:hypothetical protein
LQAHVSASSEALLYGAGPESKGFHEGLKFWRDQPQYLNERLENRRGQMIAIGSSVIDEIEVFLNNTSGTTQEVQVQLRVIDHIWDYRACLTAYTGRGNVAGASRYELD